LIASGERAARLSLNSATAFQTPIALLTTEQRTTDMPDHTNAVAAHAACRRGAQIPHPSSSGAADGGQDREYHAITPMIANAVIFHN
jgi:hypothetical protein